MFALAGAAAFLAASLAVAPSASAASHMGELAAKGPGKGATATFTIQVRNTGSTLAQFRVR